MPDRGGCPRYAGTRRGATRLRRLPCRDPPAPRPAVRVRSTATRIVVETREPSGVRSDATLVRRASCNALRPISPKRCQCRCAASRSSPPRNERPSSSSSAAAGARPRAQHDRGRVSNSGSERNWDVAYLFDVVEKEQTGETLDSTHEPCRWITGHVRTRRQRCRDSLHRFGR